MLRNTTFALLATLVAAASASAAPIVTMTQTPGVIRTQAQGGGTYHVLDFFLTNSAGADFLNYRLIVTATQGTLADPARLQDDRQSNSADVGNTAGPVDTYANTVMSAAAKEDGGFASTITPNGASYQPTGNGAAPAFTFLDWSVFDTVNGDDNNLNDFPAASGGPFAVAAPYHIARVLASGSAGTAQVLAFDSLSQGLPTTFNFTYDSNPIPEPASVALLGLAIVGGLGFLRRRAA